MKLPPLWSPTEKSVENSRLARLMAEVNAADDLDLRTYADIHSYSVRETEAFWAKAWDFMGLIGERGDGPIFVQGDKFEASRFFEGARLNFAENLLRKNDDTPALIFRGEDKVARTLSWAELHAAVSSAQQAMRAAGIGEGDRVAALIPNMPEAIIALLAAASLGAIWSSASPDFGVQGVLDRFGQIEPKLFIACDGYYYAGKTLYTGDKVAEIVAKIPSIEQAWIVPYLGRAGDVVATCPKARAWDEVLTAHPATDVEFTRLSFSHPLYILYSSGTTGTPKCIVHSGGGALMQQMKEHQLHCDLRDGDKLFYFTTCGWMMWNWLVAGLATGATLVLYDGSPFHPDGNVLFDLADEVGIDIFGTSAKYIDSLKKAGLRPRDTHKLSSVRMITSTGSPLAPESFDYVYDAIKPDVHLASISGGTDICGCFVLGNPLSPVYRGEIQGAGLGMAVDVFDDEGRHLDHGKGELVCLKPFPSIPVYFWNDADGTKYHNAYFDRFPGLWHHGDFAEWTENGGIVIHGRSDATLNPGGVRIGTAEIYRQVEQLEEIKEAIVIGQDWDNDVRVVLFVVLKAGAVLDEGLKQTIKAKIRHGASPRHVPAVIVQVPDIPRTKSGKITEIAVRDIVHGRAVKNTEALANPDALDHYRDIGDLQK
ncbi:acetoacetate--CoA ligase [Rhodomicrobium udaipurense]|uniref:Acetoacetate--CoA ligase n=3 Tax=Rhodomicrobium udaipurense TaxID=1202716 RepID=A0A8I1GIC2_9HYPH|nr:acetoacetate--CoA ligase [Rhodomicrobium udaipurense]MBJ7545001.1 acetoacetate--CoA ligase [Rhodomicrobium udaipurense]